MSLLSQTEIANYTGSLYDHFLTFRKEIIIYKEPTESYSLPSVDLIMGYNNESNSNNVTYTQVSGIYSGIKVGPDKLGSEPMTIVGADRNKENSYIKVEKDCADFIDRGNTERFVIDEISYKKASNRKVKDYLGLKFYVYDIEQIK